MNPMCPKCKVSVSTVHISSKHPGASFKCGICKQYFNQEMEPLDTQKPVDGPFYVEYEHHGHLVKVREDLKGKHRQHCLCHVCQRFNIEDHAKNCPMANVLHSICVAFNLATPVWECVQFLLDNDKLKAMKKGE